jgi:hypothetical protein
LHFWHTFSDLLQSATGLILEKDPTKTLTGQTYRQKARNSQTIDIRVGTNSNISTVIPETRGFATRVVEKVANKRNTASLSQSFCNHDGHFRKSPENLF